MCVMNAVNFCQSREIQVNTGKMTAIGATAVGETTVRKILSSE